MWSWYTRSKILILQWAHSEIGLWKTRRICVVGWGCHCADSTIRTTAGKVRLKSDVLYKNCSHFFFFFNRRCTKKSKLSKTGQKGIYLEGKYWHNATFPPNAFFRYYMLTGKKTDYPWGIDLKKKIKTYLLHLYIKSSLPHKKTLQISDTCIFTF